MMHGHTNIKVDRPFTLSEDSLLIRSVNLTKRLYDFIGNNSAKCYKMHFSPYNYTSTKLVTQILGPLLRNTPCLINFTIN